MAKRCLKLPPELGDGQHWYPSRPSGSAASNQAWAADLGENIWTWAQDATPGDEITIRLIDLTDEELEALPEM